MDDLTCSGSSFSPSISLDLRRPLSGGGDGVHWQVEAQCERLGGMLNFYYREAA